jgi:hypothetical protein
VAGTGSEERKVKSENSGEHMKTLILVFSFAITLLTVGWRSGTTKVSDQDNSEQTSPAKNIPSRAGGY